MTIKDADGREWVLVPVEATDEMALAMVNAPISGHPETGSPTVTDMWVEAIAAAPQFVPPAVARGFEMTDLSQESPLWRKWAESRHSVQQMREELDSLRAELEIARKDAGRYRWLRNESWSLTHGGRKYPRVAETVVITDPYMRVTLLAEEALDAAVDAAMGGWNG